MDFLDWITKDSISFFTFVLAIVASVQGCLIWRQITLGRQEFIASHRPRLRVRLINIKEVGFGDQITIGFTVANAGDSEATDISAEITLTVQNDEKALNTRTFKIAPVLAPGKPEVITHVMDAKYQAGWQWFRGDVRVHGHIAYKDRNGIERRTGFYRFSTKNWNRFRLPADSDIERDYEYED